MNKIESKKNPDFQVCRSSMTPHPLISEVKIVEGRNLFPISWLHQQSYCEYQIFLEKMDGIKVEPTKEMIQGKIEHKRMELEHIKDSEPATTEEMIKNSEIINIQCREFPVISLKYGIYGKIDEIRLSPNGFVMIDDKPGVNPYPSQIHQIHGYCLAFQNMIDQDDSRQIIAALRERGTNNIYCKIIFDDKAKKEIINVVDHIHGLITGKEQFDSSNNPNKCKGCRLRNDCNRFVSF